MARKPAVAVDEVEEAVSAESDLIRKLAKLRNGGERGNAIAVAIEAKLRSDQVPFLDGYAEELALRGLKFS